MHCQVLHILVVKHINMTKPLIAEKGSKLWNQRIKRNNKILIKYGYQHADTPTDTPKKSNSRGMALARKKEALKEHEIEGKYKE